ncbi:hypothetical protein [Streptomyces sp. PT12]|uniref:hypothetical protein n=1 Tax=Streptomyces sp. PT12 TaxID=1510197 RepID=UPI000DE39732|nr:hypothetical protein [Streptomyces sp. PT12]RBM20482.1 hypothetical protein DEH69_08520 [Streptomyces sp. PT12]
MTDLTPLDPASAAAGLREAGDGARGFLGVDPVTDNDALLARRLAAIDAQVFRAGDTLLGAAPNPHQPRQAYVASTSADEAALRALLGFLVTYRRTTSWVALAERGAPAVEALRRCGFEERGALRDHRFRAGAAVDVLVWFGKAAAPCPS